MTKDSSKLPVPDEMREFAERSVDQARKAVDGFMHAAQEAASPILSTSGPFPEPLTDAGRKAMDFAEANIAASFAFAKQLINASSLDEIVALQNKFLEEQIKVMGDQVAKLHKVVINSDNYKRK